MTTQQYLETFFAETRKVHNALYSIEDSEGITHVITPQTVVESILTAPKEEQKKIAHVIRQLDFHNGPLMPFLEHLAHGLIANYKPTEGD